MNKKIFWRHNEYNNFVLLIYGVLKYSAVQIIRPPMVQLKVVLIVNKSD